MTSLMSASTKLSVISPCCPVVAPIDVPGGLANEPVPLTMIGGAAVVPAGPLTSVISPDESVFLVVRSAALGAVEDGAAGGISAACWALRMASLSSAQAERNKAATAA